MILFHLVVAHSIAIVNALVMDAFTGDQRRFPPTPSYLEKGYCTEHLVRLNS